MTSPTDFRTPSKYILKNSFQFPLVQQVLKFVEKHGSYSPKSSGTFFMAQGVCTKISKSESYVSSSINILWSSVWISGNSIGSINTVALHQVAFYTKVWWPFACVASWYLTKPPGQLSLAIPPQVLVPVMTISREEIAKFCITAGFTTMTVGKMT